MNTPPAELPRIGAMPRPTNIAEGYVTMRKYRTDAPVARNLVSVTLESDECTSLCPFSDQPDFWSVSITYNPDGHILESKSLKFYLWSFREFSGTCEAIADQIADHVFNAVEPIGVSVDVVQRPRGGITIKATAVRVREDVAPDAEAKS